MELPARIDASPHCRKGWEVSMTACTCRYSNSVDFFPTLNSFIVRRDINIRIVNRKY